MYALVEASPLPIDLFNHDQQKVQLTPILDKFSSVSDATNLGKELGYMLISDQAFKQANQKNRELTTYDFQHQISGHNHFQCLGDNALTWAHNNISPLAFDIRHSFSTPGRKSVGPHCDRSRNYTLIYLHTNGGPHHSTVFYQETGFSVERPIGYFVNDYRDLKEISRIQIPLNTWTLLNSRVLHSIEHIPEIRSAIQISFHDFPENLNFIHKIYCQS